MKHKLLFTIFTVIFSFSILFAGTTGKIAGTVSDAETGEKLPGVNIVIKGTSLGAATDINGYYVILNVPPGAFNVQANMMGYKLHQYSDVRVKIDLTTSINFALTPAVLAGEEVTVVAVRPLVERDVAASQLNVTADHIQALPVATVDEVVGLQAGVTSALEIRGGGSDESIFMVDGIIMRDERNNTPISAVPLSAVQEVSVQTGGFSAEYGNVRSGVVNVVTREGEKDRYGGAFTFKIRPPDAKHFGISPYDAESYWLRPYLDEAVCWTGTENGAWDEYEQRQFPQFDGWNEIANRTLNDDDPDNDLTPAAARRIYQWEHRKEGDIDKPDYNVDAGFGGPVPFLSDKLGNLRFYGSYFKEQDQYLVKLSRDGLSNESWMLKLTSDISPSMKLSLMGLYGETYGTNYSRTGGTSYIDDVWDIAEAVDRAGFTVPWRLYTNDYYSPTSRFYHTFSAKLTHMLNPATFYELQLKRVGRKYYTTPGRPRDHETMYEIFDGYYANEAPFGFEEEPTNGIDGLGMGGSVSTSRDYSKVASHTLKFDIVSQVNSTNEFKGGVEFTYDNLNLAFGQVNKFLPEGNSWTVIDQSPFRFNLYLQDKMELKGFIATMGFIFEHSNPNGDWYDVGIFDPSLYSQNYSTETDADIPKKKAKAQTNISPRLAISHPITENSKLYFNYGHYRQKPTSEKLYRVQRLKTNQLSYIGDPEIPLARTVAYELGYDHAVFENYLFHLSAYYKDISDQEDWTRYISQNGQVNYRQLTANSYEDIRGFEFELRKIVGKWIIGNINYEYRVGTSGYFGYGEFNENQADQREYERRNPKQTKPRPRPRFKSYIDFHSPRDFGATYWGIKPLGEWHLNLIARWTGGKWDTWNPNQKPGIEYNVQWKDTYSFDIKLSKTIPVGNFDFKFFMDVYNLFNIKSFSGESFTDVHDYNFYMESLHLPSSITDELGYGNIPGEDRIGDVRKDDVAYQPMEWTADLEKITDPNTRAIYYDASNKKYMQYSNDAWVQADQGLVDKVLDEKAYIDMPNQTYFTFLNPRDVFFGFTLSYNF